MPLKQKILMLKWDTVDNPHRDIESSTRRKLKQEMFSDVSGVVNTKNMAIVGIAGIVGYLLARK